EPGCGEKLRTRREVETRTVMDSVSLSDELDRKVRFARCDVRLQQVVPYVLSIGRRREREHALEVLGHDDRSIALHRLPAVDGKPSYEVGELGERTHLLLRPALSIREPEVELEDVVPVRILMRDVVVVAVVPRDPAGRAGEERRVQNLPVV